MQYTIVNDYAGFGVWGLCISDIVITHSVQMSSHVNKY